MSLCKTDLINLVAKNTTDDLVVTKKDLKILIDATFEAVKAMTLDGSLVIHNFGVFKMATRAARTGHNPQTRAVIQIPESTTLRFKAAKLSK
jgi:nucleoid DNA-binding protein